MFDRSVEPKELVLLDTDLHGTTLATSGQFGAQILGLLRDFVPPLPALVAG